MKEKNEIPAEEFTSVNSIVKDVFGTVGKIIDKKISLTGISTGFGQLDLRTNGLYNSKLTIIAGEPSMGKTSLALSIAYHIGVEEKIPVGILSLDIPKEKLVQRILCSDAEVAVHKMRTGFLGEHDWPKLAITGAKLSEAPIFIDDTSGISISEVCEKARRLKAANNIGVFMVDPLQLIHGITDTETMYNEISEISSALKGLAKELDIPVVALLQMEPFSWERYKHKPNLSDLRKSGTIEKNADLILILLREEMRKETPENKGKAEMNIVKQRGGPTGTFELTFIEEYAKFKDLS